MIFMDIEVRRSRVKIGSGDWRHGPEHVVVVWKSCEEDAEEEAYRYEDILAAASRFKRLSDSYGQQLGRTRTVQCLSNPFWMIRRGLSLAGNAMSSMYTLEAAIIECSG